MNRPSLLSLALLTALLSGAVASAQDNPPPPAPGGKPPGPPRGEGPGPGPGPGFRHGGPDDRPLLRWMDKRREQNPEEFDRLHKLRNDNPAEFRRQLMSRLGEERLRRSLREFPEVEKALQQVPEDRRRAFLASLAEPFPGGPDGEGFGPRPQPGNPERAGPVRPDFQREMGDTLRRFHESRDDTERGRIRAEVREKIGAFYDRRIQERKDSLRRMEEELNRLRREVEEQDKLRDRAIDDRLRALLENRNPP